MSSTPEKPAEKKMTQAEATTAGAQLLAETISASIEKQTEELKSHSEAQTKALIEATAESANAPVAAMIEFLQDRPEGSSNGSTDTKAIVQGLLEGLRVDKKAVIDEILATLNLYPVGQQPGKGTPRNSVFVTKWQLERIQKAEDLYSEMMRALRNIEGALGGRINKLTSSFNMQTKQLAGKGLVTLASAEDRGEKPVAITADESDDSKD